jgi:AcrR family transcriptional regulator
MKSEASPRDEARAVYRRAILRAAEEVFADSDYYAARMNDIAARAKLAVGTIYNHFEHKADVLAALVEERMTELGVILRAAPSDPRDFEGQLTARLERMLGYVAAHRGFFGLAIDYGLLGGTRAARQLFGTRKPPKVETAKPQLRELVREGVDAGEIEGDDVDTLFRFLGSAIRAVIMQMLEDPKTRAADGARRIVSFFLDGARAKKKKSRQDAKSAKAKNST